MYAQPTAQLCAGLTYAESLSLLNRTLGCWIPNVLFDHYLLYPTYEDMSPAESQALCRRLGRGNLVSEELGLQTNQSGRVKPAVINLILERQCWVRVLGLPRMATVVTAMPAPIDVRVATGRGRSWKKPPR